MGGFPITIGPIHFVGIGGIGMSGIAEVMHNLGYCVQGCDMEENTNVRRLRRLGVPVSIGHSAQHVQGAAAVVISSAVARDNIEVSQARALGVPIVHRAEMLGELMRLRRAIAVAGSHGKTTTTSLASALLDQAGLDPTVVNGGIINAYGSNARLGTGEWIVVEADESDGSFSKLPATICIVTNIDPEHVNHFANYGALVDAFAQFISNIPFYGVAILCADHPIVASLSRQTTDRRVITYGLSSEADVSAKTYHLEKRGVRFSVQFSEECCTRYADQLTVASQQAAWSDFFLPMIGKHNIQNALSIVALALELRLSPEDVRLAFRSFMGVGRRFSILAEEDNIRIVDDYGHHPVEIRATLEAARGITPGKLWTVIQPHRYTRLYNLFPEFLEVLELADRTFITPLYTAGEPAITGVGSLELVQKARERSLSVSYTETPKDLQAVVLSQLQSGDTVVFLGAGTISHWAHSFSEAFISSNKERDQ
ncbi:MAG: UDP-N-acetylmuramate--L-alanine ligase [Holosporales bacterium]|jgi:UDP-N-acetylmuramate--alanine ligase|nr:UDP-N-acetylmuramate--L-alanine ligase [Holosporales bacterium]